MKAIVVGYGLAGRSFHTLLLKISGIEIAAIVVRNTERRALARRDCPQSLLCETLDEALVSCSPNEATLVVIATPTDTHVPLAIHALQAGRHVVVDKPVALNAVQWQQAMTVAKTHQRLLIPFQNRRWDADFLTLQSLIKQNSLGSIIRYEARFDRYNPVVRDRWREHDIPGAGVLYDLGAHLIDQALVLFGMPQWVWCRLLKQRLNAQIDDGFELIMGSDDSDYPHIALGASMFAAAGLEAHGAPRFKIFGKKATWIKSGFDPQEEPLRAGIAPSPTQGITEKPEACGELIDGATGQIQPTQAGVGHWPCFYTQVTQAIQSGMPAPVLPEQALQTCMIIDAAMRSHQCGGNINLSG